MVEETVVTTERIIGKIFSKEEADRNYGPVLFSVKIPTSEFRGLIAKSKKYLMFNLKDGRLSILKEGRVPLYPEDFNVGGNERNMQCTVKVLLNSC